MILEILLAARLCASFPCDVEGVTVLSQQQDAPKCRSIGVADAWSFRSVDHAVLKVIKHLKGKKANVIRIEKTQTGTNNHVAIGRGYRCEEGVR